MSKPIASCKSCTSENLAAFDAEANLHTRGLKGLARPPVFAYPKLLVCLDCGFAEFVVPEAALQQLRQGREAFSQASA